MREEYDFSNSIKNPYAQKKKKQISINIEIDTIAYLTDCVSKKVEPTLQWERGK
jgi:hypothetical protein